MVEAERRLSDACAYCKDHECCKEWAVVARPGKSARELIEAHYGRDAMRVQFTIQHRCPHLGAAPFYNCDLFDDDPEQDRRPNMCKHYLCAKAENPDLMVIEVRS